MKVWLNSISTLMKISPCLRKIFRARAKVVVMGMGKSGHIGRKMAATFASTGTPSFSFTGEAAHGDLGMVTPKDVVIALSNRRVERDPGADSGAQTPAGSPYLHHQPPGKQHGARGGHPP